MEVDGESDSSNTSPDRQRNDASAALAELAGAAEAARKARRVIEREARGQEKAIKLLTQQLARANAEIVDKDRELSKLRSSGPSISIPNTRHTYLLDIEAKYQVLLSEKEELEEEVTELTTRVKDLEEEIVELGGPIPFFAEEREAFFNARESLVEDGHSAPGTGSETQEPKSEGRKQAARLNDIPFIPEEEHVWETDDFGQLREVAPYTKRYPPGPPPPPEQVLPGDLPDPTRPFQTKDRGSWRSSYLSRLPGSNSLAGIPKSGPIRPSDLNYPYRVRELAEQAGVPASDIKFPAQARAISVKPSVRAPSPSDPPPSHNRTPRGRPRNLVVGDQVVILNKVTPPPGRANVRLDIYAFVTGISGSRIYLTTYSGITNIWRYRSSLRPLRPDEEAYFDRRGEPSAPLPKFRKSA